MGASATPAAAAVRKERRLVLPSIVIKLLKRTLSYQLLEGRFWARGFWNWRSLFEGRHAGRGGNDRRLASGSVKRFPLESLKGSPVHPAPKLHRIEARFVDHSHSPI